MLSNGVVLVGENGNSLSKSVYMINEIIMMMWLSAIYVSKWKRQLYLSSSSASWRRQLKTWNGVSLISQHGGKTLCGNEKRNNHSVKLLSPFFFGISIYWKMSLMPWPLHAIENMIVENMCILNHSFSLKSMFSSVYLAKEKQIWKQKEKENDEEENERRKQMLMWKEKHSLSYENSRREKKIIYI